MEQPDFSAFGQFIPGFDFLQKLASQATGGVAPGLQSATAAMPSLGHWIAPTFSVEEIDKRIQDLRAVQFWLDQNGKALGATIQALEVQKMTLSTLENMNLSLKDVAESFKIRPEAMQAAQPAQAAPKPEPKPEPKVTAQAQAKAQEKEEKEEEEAKPQVDPMQWWNSLTEQFTTIASTAMQDMAGQAAKAAEQVAQSVQAGAEQMAQTVQASAEAAEKMAEQAKEEASRAASAVNAASRKRAAPAKKAGAKSAAAPASASSRARKKPAAD